MDLIAEGQTNRQIAEAMYLAEHTVKNYITGLLKKLKMNSRTEAAIYATKLKASGSESRRGLTPSAGQGDKVDSRRCQLALKPSPFLRRIGKPRRPDVDMVRLTQLHQGAVVGDVSCQ